MPWKPRPSVMLKDDPVWKVLKDGTEEWYASVRQTPVYRSIVDFILQRKPGKAVEMHPVIRGGFNLVYRLEYADGTSTVMRIPQKGNFAFPDEKVRYEVATMKYFAAHTTIPIPCIYRWGTAAENPTGLGPFIIMQWIEHEDEDVVERIINPSRRTEDEDVSAKHEKVEFIYLQMANILLQLSKLSFPRIGSLCEDASEEWYADIARLHTAQLALQYNDAVKDDDDTRNKFVARLLFRILAAERRLLPKTSGERDKGFMLFSKDIRPYNVLFDKELRAVDVVDWEFAYVAPRQFSYDPPWWLISDKPEWWDNGPAAWMEAYEPRLEIFLRVLEEEEDEEKMQESKPSHKPSKPRKSNGSNEASLAEHLKALSLTKEVVPLSQRMRESWKDGTWIMNYAARDCWAFDWLWWRYLDQRYFGPNEDYEHRARLDFLSRNQRDAMETFVQRKARDREDRRVVVWDEEAAAERVAEITV